MVVRDPGKGQGGEHQQDGYDREFSQPRPFELT
jgi:hypothetical protein